MGEDDIHVQATVDCISFLQYWFRNRTDVYVIGNNFVYWNEGHPRDRVSPDCYVVLGVEKHRRPSYKSWEEDGKLPDVVFEFTSRSTRHQDTERKFRLYEQVWKAQEYFLFDPDSEFLTPQLKGYTLVQGRYEPIDYQNNRMHSNQLGLDLEVHGSYLRFFDPLTNELLPTIGELRSEANVEYKRAEAERLRAEESDRELKTYQQRTRELEAELAELRRLHGKVE